MTLFTLPWSPAAVRAPFLLLLLLVVSVARADDNGEQSLHGLDAFVERALVVSKVPGAAVTVVRSGQPPEFRSYGRRSVESGEQVDADTVFAIGSVTKNFTATALAMLVDEGLLEWDTPIRSYLSRLQFADPYLLAKLSTADALSHRSGLQRADMIWFSRQGASRGEMLDSIARLEVEAPFRASYLYNNFLYLAAGEIVPAVTGISWDDFVEARILAPLGMSRSGTRRADREELDNVATPHFVTPDDAIATGYYDLDHLGPAGSVYSTARDMARWCELQLDIGDARERTRIDSAMLDATREPRTLMVRNSEGHAGRLFKAYAFGLEYMDHSAGVGLYTHGGAIQGMASNLAFAPERGLCVAVLTNGQTGTGFRYAVTDWIVDRLLGADVSAAQAKLDRKMEAFEHRFVATATQHMESHDPSVPATLSSDDLVGIYRNPVYGEVAVSLEEGVLRSRTGGGARAELEHHRGNSYDVVSPDTSRQQALPAPPVVTFNLDGSGDASSLLLQLPGPGAPGIRYLRERPVGAEGAR